ncbi:hypothetical protein [Paraburkholderia youngii]|uniref:hypothetical protein n=1 Tax=Paraburkholderia youngii TaxID=2782701 RepID=UPI003D1FB587
MGWKRFKEHFGITHIVHVTSDGICIGSRLASAFATTIATATGEVRESRAVGLVLACFVIGG